MSWPNFLRERGYAIDADTGRLVVPAPARAEAPAVCVDLGHHALLRLGGPDARTFLQGYLTCDVADLAAHRALPGAFCNIQGRVVADGVLVELAGMPAFWLHASLREPLVVALRKYLAFSKSKFLAADDAWVTLGLAGKAADLRPLPDSPFAAGPFEGGVAIRMPGDPRWLLLLPHASAVALWIRFESVQAIADAALWDLHDIRARWARVTAATTESFLPQMLGFTSLGAVSFSKGCYLGQEIVARAEHRGEVKRRLAHARWTGPAVPQPGDVIRDAAGRTLAIVASAAPVGAGQGEALVVASAAGSGATAAGVTFELA
jgi:hypothetical protein